MSKLNPGFGIKINRPATKKLFKAIQFAVKAPTKKDAHERLKDLATLSDDKLAEASSKMDPVEKKSLVQYIDHLNDVKSYLV